MEAMGLLEKPCQSPKSDSFENFPLKWLPLDYRMKEDEAKRRKADREQIMKQWRFI